MVAISQSKQPRSSQLHSSKLRSASEHFGNLEKKNHSSSHTGAEHLVFGFEQLDLPAQFILCAPCQIEQKRRKPTYDVMKPYVSEVESDGDKLFAPLESADLQPSCHLKMSIGDKLGQSMKFGDNCAL